LKGEDFLGKQAKIAVYLIIGIVLIASAFSDKTSKSPEDQSPNIATSIQAFEEARDNNESIWLLFRSETCQPCAEMMKTFNKIAPDYQGKVSFIAIDVDDDDNIELVREWKIQYVPSSFILDAEGNVSYEYIGIIPADDLKNELDKVVE